MIIKYKVEQINPNDMEFLVLDRCFNDGDLVKKGQVLFELEGQKTAFEVLCESDGYIYSEFFSDSYIDVDEVAYLISDVPDVSVDDLFVYDDVVKRKKDPEIVEEIGGFKLNINGSAAVNIAVVPGGKAFRQVEDALEGNWNFSLVGYFDDDNRSSLNRIGSANIKDIVQSWKDGIFDRIFVATGDCTLRTSLINGLSDAGIGLINVVHPTAYVSSSATLGSNVFVGPKSSIGANSIVSSGAFISAFSNVEHHCYLNENVLLGPGVMLSGSVRIGSRSILGAGVAVESNIKIGCDVYVAPGLGISQHIDSLRRVLT